jgi:putative tryptophan/tyrosine transport system substrate-binding protein
MDRRAFVTGLGAVLAAPLGADAQQPGRKLPQIGFVQQGNPSDVILLRIRAAFNEGLREHGGHVDGQNIAIEYRTGDIEGLMSAARDLVNRKVDLIVAGGTPAGLAAQRATNTIPIVVGAMADPVADGLVTSLAHPGGNITGTSFLAPALGPKRLQLLKELIPAVRRVAILLHRGVYSERTMNDMVKSIEAAAAGIDVQVVNVTAPNDFKTAFFAIANARAGAIMIFPSPMFYVNYRQIVDLASKHRLPAMYVFREAVEVGGLMCYGANLPDLFRQSAAYVDKILKGAKPADLPVEQPTKFELVINLKTAKALGLTIPPSLLLRADQVIE